MADSRSDTRDSWYVTVEGAATGFTQSVVAGGHAFVTDEPVSAGGADAGPEPYALLLAALGSCVSMTLGMYARRKSWPLERVLVRLRHSRVHADDCLSCETKSGLVDRIEREIVLVGALDDEQRARLLEIANKCPVHRTLTSEIDIRTQLVAS